MSQNTGLDLHYFTWSERPDLMAQAWRLRHQRLIDKRGWSLESRRMLEIDRYDSTARHCAVTVDELLIGYARGNPTDRPHLLGDCFSNLLPARDRPCSPRIWEVSRFVFDPAYLRTTRVLAALIDGAMAMGPRVAAQAFVAVVEPWMERAVARRGYAPERLSPPRVVGYSEGRPVWAHVAFIDLTTARVAGRAA